MGRVDDGDEEAVAGDVDGGAGARAPLVDEVDAQRLAIATAAALIGGMAAELKAVKGSTAARSSGCLRNQVMRIICR